MWPPNKPKSFDTPIHTNRRPKHQTDTATVSFLTAKLNVFTPLKIVASITSRWGVQQAGRGRRGLKSSKAS